MKHDTARRLHLRGPANARRVVCEGAARVADAPVAMLLEATPGGLVLVVSEVLGADVDRREHMLSGCSACEYHVRFKSPQENS